MNLYLVRHGVAKEAAEDPERPLRPEGIAAARRTGEALARLGATPREILHSGKRRAAETAEILRASLSPPNGVRVAEGLAPNDDPARIADLVLAAGDESLLVGHLPHLARLAGLLLAGDPSRTFLAFRECGAAKLHAEGPGAGPGAWKLAWFFGPEDLDPEVRAP